MSKTNHTETKAEETARLKKEAGAAPELKYYDVKYETQVPATVTYRVLAETPEEALELSKRSSSAPVNIQYVLARRRDTKASVYDAGSTMIRLIKNIIR